MQRNANRYRIVIALAIGLQCAANFLWADDSLLAIPQVAPAEQICFVLYTVDEGCSS